MCCVYVEKGFFCRFNYRSVESASCLCFFSGRARKFANQSHGWWMFYFLGIYLFFSQTAAKDTYFTESCIGEFSPLGLKKPHFLCCCILCFRTFFKANSFPTLFRREDFAMPELARGGVFKTFLPIYT